MKKTLKLIGIIAIMALIITAGMTSCDGLLGEEEEAFVFAGTLSISPSTGTIYVGDKLTASFFSSNTTPEEKAVIFQWFKNDGSENGKLEIVSNEFEPKEAGSYSVRVTSQKDTSQSKELTVTVVLHPANDFFGEWLMKGSEQTTKWPNTTTQYNETIVIKKGNFRLDSTDPGLNGATGSKYQSGGLDIPNDYHDYAASSEYLEYTITGWDEITLSGNDATTYSKGFKLTVSNGTTKGYDPNYTSFNLYLLKGSGTATIELQRSTNNGEAVLARIYKKQ